MFVPEGRLLFRRQPRRSNPYRVFLLLLALVGSLFVYRGYASGEIQPMTVTPTATRVPDSFIIEADTRFKAGDLNGAIAAYQEAIQLNPDDGRLLAELARLQTYSSTLLTTDEEALERMLLALKNINRAAELEPESSLVHAVRSFVLDWNSSAALASPDDRVRMLNDAEQAAMTAISLDSRNALAHAYYAEIQVDKQRWADARNTINRAEELDPTLMDVYRVLGYVEESNANYDLAIEAYEKALQITPNLTFLHLRVGYNWRTIANNMPMDMLNCTICPQRDTYEQALEAFAKAVDIDKQLGIRDPVPYIAIAKTYSQMGEFFAASWNILTAVEMNPTSADVYGQMGVIYFKARNYESSIPPLRCAVEGCDADTSCEVRQCNAESDPRVEIRGLPLSENTLVYYYTYGSVLAAMHQPATPYCPDAMNVFKEIRKLYSGDELTMSIIAVGEDTCRSLGYR